MTPFHCINLYCVLPVCINLYCVLSVFPKLQLSYFVFRPLIGCIGDVFINDDRLALPDAVNVYNVFHGNCNSSDVSVFSLMSLIDFSYKNYVIVMEEEVTPTFSNNKEITFSRA